MHPQCMTLGSLVRGGLVPGEHLTRLQRRDIPAAKKSKLRRLLGNWNCVIRELIVALGTFVRLSPYTVVAKDGFSVALVSASPISGKQICHIHFEADYYWVCLDSGRVREFFKRIK